MPRVPQESQYYFVYIGVGIGKGGRKVLVAAT